MAKTIEDQIEALIVEFTGNLSLLVRQAAVQAVQQALAGGAPARPAAGRRAKVTRKKAGKKKASRKKAGRRGGQSAEQIEKLAGQVLDYVKANKGSRLEEISAGLGIDSAKLKTPIKGMLDAGALKKTGQKRGTKYSAK
ncbi:MAG: hypothetical protein H6828_06795 [Planctomycetes bacterium]|nr:hypothetical protein [Planctomycetota bacterium]